MFPVRYYFWIHAHWCKQPQVNFIVIRTCFATVTKKKKKESTHELMFLEWVTKVELTTESAIVYRLKYVVWNEWNAGFLSSLWFKFI